MRKLIIFFFSGIVIIVGILLTTFLISKNRDKPPVWTMLNTNIGQGKQSLVKYGCYACHVIPKISKGAGRVGPKLEEIAEQIYIGGVLPNSPDNMIKWLQDPQQYSPNTAMPDMDVNQEDARNMTAHLFKIR